MNEVVIPAGKKDAWNASKPTNDGQFLPYVTDPEVARPDRRVYGIPAPATPRNDLVSVFLTGVDGLNMPDGRGAERGAPAEHVDRSVHERVFDRSA